MAYKKNNDDGFGVGSGESSNFNEAGLQIQRLHNSWMRCRQLRLDGNFIGWRWELDVIWSELSTDARRLNPTWDSNEWNTTVRGLDKLISLSVDVNSGKLLYRYLDAKEKYLKKLQDASGKGGSYKKPEEKIHF